MSVTKFKPDQAPAAALLAELNAEKQAVTRFIALLRTEQRALKEGLVDSLEQLAQEKSVLVGELNGLEARRDRNAASAGADGAGIESWIGRVGGMQATRCWLELLDLAREARRINQINGILIDTLMRNNKQALNLLQAAAQRASLYGPDGRSENYSGGRMLGAV
jgi:flagellar biosynthesis protein FlgN